jgi:hypothetical protein
MIDYVVSTLIEMCIRMGMGYIRSRRDGMKIAWKRMNGWDSMDDEMTIGLVWAGLDGARTIFTSRAHAWFRFLLFVLACLELWIGS